METLTLRMVNIYALIDPRDGEIRYVGKTVNVPAARLGQHLRDKKHKGHRRNWIDKLKRMGYKPQIQVIQEVHPDSASQAEVYWIKYFRDIGCRLTNNTDGGEGQVGWKPTNETKAKISASVTKFFEEHPEAREAMSKRHKGKTAKNTLSPEKIQAFIAFSKQPWSVERRAKMSVIAKARKHSPERIAKWTESMRLYRERKALCQSST